jgi:autotransporter-associated beta strand protein
MLLAWWRMLTNSKSQEAKRRARTPFSRPRFRGLQLEWLEERLAPATYTWSGAVSNLWSNNANWAGGSPAGDPNANLVFPSGAKNIDTNNNDLVGLTIGSMTFSGGGYKIFGNAVTLNAGITLTSEATESIHFNPNIVLGAAQTFAVTDAGVALYLEGTVSGAGSARLTEAGAGILALDAANTFEGGTVLSAGILFVLTDTSLGKGTLTLLGGTLESGVTPVKLVGQRHFSNWAKSGTIK